jgi:hypothetical protein
MTWARISTNDKPDVNLMIQLLNEMGFQLLARPSGATCLQTLAQHADAIEQALSAESSNAPPDPNVPPPSNDNPVQEAFSEETQGAPQQRDAAVIPFDDTSQCENSLLAEAKERLLSCVMSSFRTDAGVIMLENDLIMFEDVAPEDVAGWVLRTRAEWDGRLHSKVVDDFHESLDLWVLSQRLQD